MQEVGVPAAFALKKRPCCATSRQSHFSGLTRQVGWRMFHGFQGEGSMSPFSRGMFSILHRGGGSKTSDGGMLHSQCLRTASCLRFVTSVSCLYQLDVAI